MNQKLSLLVTELESLQSIINTAAITEGTFSRLGWNQSHVDKATIESTLFNLVNQIEQFSCDEITEGLDRCIDSHIANVSALSTTCKTYFTEQPAHLIHLVPTILLTVLTIHSDINFELFSYENIEDKKLLPRGLAQRLRSTNTHVERLNDKCGDLDAKVTAINAAHDAANSLPTDLESIQDAKRELEKLISSAKNELETEKKEIEQLKHKCEENLNFTDSFMKQSADLSADIESAAIEAKKLVDQCDDALQITTTQGLAAGFDQKAKELRRSIWFWTLALVAALVAGVYLGWQRVDGFSDLLKGDITVGQAMVHIVMLIFTVGGPLWLAWISTQQINQRFKLSEDYSYKATVAKSFTGFKKFAERFDDETEKRLFNSTLDRFDEMPLRLIDGKDYNSPWHEFVDSEAFKTAAAAIPGLAGEAMRFAKNTKLKAKPKFAKVVDIDKIKQEAVPREEEAS